MATSPFRRSAPAATNPHRATSRIALGFNGNEALKSRAEELAHELELPLVMTGDPGSDLQLVLTPEHLELRDPHDPRLGPVFVDFTPLDLRPYSANLSRRQPLARAFGKKVRTIADATAGYGQDALLLALMGFHVTAIERSPVVVALAQDGLNRLTTLTGMVLSERLRLVNGDSRSLLPTLAPRPDAIYLDPMFPPKRRKSAAVKKEMRLLRQLVGDDADALELLEISRGVAHDRVVVKRPDDAPPLAPDPSMSLTGKLVRYDVYLARHRTKT
ncbi:MAG: class I SAM-dependent methyltransferase [Sulfuricaulis sp.]|uniref:class I SAM-dependent methyltransferase n=1 Tax=Sulfuricaulis sp. TaxID=2003553 RepID=UPI0025FE8821|nr:class I SAM-dependent methyltransferase [Sulfuricaulis sp.]MCR4346738.1 class I SAM-dependent methyltransferase [Sulfuricaulis sp.]